MQYINKAYLLIGGNVGNMFVHLLEAVNLLKACGNVYSQSAIYKTAAWGITDQPAFLNQALELHTGYTAGQLLPKLLDIEERMGRIRKEKYGPRIIDIDILLFNKDVIREASITVPHPEMQNRRFALIPLAEIAGSICHPVFNKTVIELLKECKDQSEVRKI